LFKNEEEEWRRVEKSGEEWRRVEKSVRRVEKSGEECEKSVRRAKLKKVE